MIYQDVARFAESWGLVFLVIMFIVGVGYAYWPTHKAKFTEAANRPLDEE